MNAIVNEAIALLPNSSVERVGHIVRAYGTTLRASGLNAQIGSRVSIRNKSDSSQHDVKLQADVVGIDASDLLLYPLGSIDGIELGSEVALVDHSHKIEFSSKMLGHVYNGLGQAMDDSPLFDAESVLPINAEAPSPMLRQSINEVFTTGIKAIDGLLTVGCGQRVGIFAPAGAGKSTLLNMLAAESDTDVVVIALIGERGREVAEFIHELLDDATRARSVLIVATSDRPAMERVLAARYATTIAEGFRAQGKNVLLLMDSLTRYARALRDIGLSVGETPVRRGYPSSVFADLPKLLERSGNDASGSITAFYTVLMEDEDTTDPIAEETRSILDGHIMLTRKLGENGHYPAIDVLSSVSRLFQSLCSPEHQAYAKRVRQLLAKYNDIEFLVQVGEYNKGSDELADAAIERHDDLLAFLQQTHDSRSSFESTLNSMRKLGSG